MRVRFLKNPVGKYNLVYEVGETASLSDSLANDLIEDKHAEKVEDEVNELTSSTEEHVKELEKKIFEGAEDSTETPEKESTAETADSKNKSEKAIKKNK